MTNARQPTREAMDQAQKVIEQTRYDREPPKAGRVKSFDTMALKLADAAKLFDSDNLQNKRDAVAFTIMAINDYLNARGISGSSRKPLMRILSALIERERNLLDPIFCERKAAHAPQSPLIKLHEDGVIAALANHWLEYHRDKTMKQKDQFPIIARLLQGKGLGDVTASRIKQARELVSQEAKNHPAKIVYYAVVGHLKTASDEWGPKSAISIILPVATAYSRTTD